MSEQVLLTTYTRIKQRLRHIARRLLGDDAEVDDQLQESFCRLWLHRDKFDSPSATEAIMVTTVKHLCIDTLRRRSTERDYLDTSQPDPADELDDAERSYDSREQLRVIEMLIESKLTVAQQRILRMREYDGMETAEIAAELGMQPEAVRMQLSRARKTIRECYQSLNNPHQ
jgi:RNA polymerase sigma-70 factor (ECF subfamily)